MNSEPHARLRKIDAIRHTALRLQRGNKFIGENKQVGLFSTPKALRHIDRRSKAACCIHPTSPKGWQQSLDDFLQRDRAENAQRLSRRPPRLTGQGSGLWP